MQIFTMHYNLELRKLTFYGFTRPQSIRKLKQISGQTILSSPQDLEFNLNFKRERVEGEGGKRFFLPLSLTPPLRHFFELTFLCVFPGLLQVNYVHSFISNFLWYDIQLERRALLALCY